MATIQDLRDLGLRVGFAHGSVAVEEEALAAAQADAAPDVVIEKVQSVTTTTLSDLANSGVLADATPEQRKNLAERIAASALEEITVRVTEKVAFHERALAIAQASPDVWRVEHIVEVDGQEHRIFSSMVATKDDGTGWDEDNQVLLDSWACPKGFNENSWFVAKPEADAAARQLRLQGCEVQWPALGDSDVFTVDGRQLDCAALIDHAAAATTEA